MTKPCLVAHAVCALSLAAQDNPAGQLKHLSVPVSTNIRPLSVAAMQIERTMAYPSIIHLKGSVEIRTPVCLHTKPENGQTSACDGYMVVRADEADLHEDTGQIEASGNVKITRESSGFRR